MTKMIQVEPSLRQSDRKAVPVEARVWDGMREAGRSQGFAVTNETTIGPIEAGLFAAAVRRALSQGRPARGGRGSDRFTAAGPSILNEPDAKGKVNEVLSLLEAGGVVLTKRTW